MIQRTARNFEKSVKIDSKIRIYNARRNARLKLYTTVSFSPYPYSCKVKIIFFYQHSGTHNDLSSENECSENKRIDVARIQNNNF